jgi:hypothetical protein
MKDGHCADDNGVLGDGSWSVQDKDLVWYPAGGTDAAMNGIIVDFGKAFVKELYRTFMDEIEPSKRAAQKSAKRVNDWLSVEKGRGGYPVVIVVSGKDEFFQKVLAGENSGDGYYTTELIEHDPLVSQIHVALVNHGFMGAYNIFTDKDADGKNVIRIGVDADPCVPTVQNVADALVGVED